MLHFNASGPEKFRWKVRLVSVAGKCGRDDARLRKFCFPQSRFHCQLAASSSNHFLSGAGLDELESIAEGASLPDQRMNLDRAEG